MPKQAESEQQSKRRGGNILSNLLIVVGVALLVAAGVIYYNNWQNYDKIDKENERVAQYVKLSDEDDNPPDVDWEALKAMNPDIVGWLQVPGTVVNYPVLHTTDNEYYLNRAPDKSESIGGSVFMDFENTVPGMVDAQTIIYGHHMRNGSQFKQIADMDDQKLFDGIKTVWYVTEQGAYKLEPVFLYYINENDTDVRQFTFKDQKEFQEYLHKYLDQAVTRRADADQIVDKAKHVLTLSTCNYYEGYGRTLLVCAIKAEVE
ncbi:MAG: class B sortase [Coriobacteriales bacterium]|nr:class B sortase [Coriobacteriales bacterium]